MKTYWGSGGIAPLILDLGTRWRWVVSFTPRPPCPQGKIPCYPRIGGWVGPRAVLDAVVKRKIPSPRRESNPRTPIVQPVTQRYTDWAINLLKTNDKLTSTSQIHKRKHSTASLDGRCIPSVPRTILNHAAVYDAHVVITGAIYILNVHKY
jgi:hypothetical protein